MKAYVELKRGLPVNSDLQKAIDGFESLVYDIKTFTKEDIVLGKFDYAALNNVFVGSIDTMTALFNRLDKLPEPIDYPNFLFQDKLMNRDVWKMTLWEFYQLYANDYVSDESISYFVKPVATKLFDGVLINKLDCLTYFNSFPDKTEVWVSEQIEILSEFRAYVHNNRFVQCSNYSGPFLINPEWACIYKLIDSYKDAPVSYTIDVAILKDGSTDVIEFNDFWAIGSYGLDSMKYAEMLRDRYFQIVGG